MGILLYGARYVGYCHPPAPPSQIPKTQVLLTHELRVCGFSSPMPAGVGRAVFAGGISLGNCIPVGLGPPSLQSRAYIITSAASQAAGLEVDLHLGLSWFNKSTGIFNLS